MDIGVNAVATTYTPLQAYSQQGMTAAAIQPNPATSVANRQQTPTSPTSSQADSQPQSSATDLQSTASKPAKSTPAQNTTSTASSVANFTFEVDQQNHRIVKLSDGNGILIYQIPSKGQLALISAQENEQRRIALVA
jgi:hypothetical protein